MTVDRAADRIVVIGPTGAGKTTLAVALQEKTGHPLVELDALNLNPDWTRADLETYRSRVLRAIDQEKWIVVGHYPQSRDLVWPQADLIVWLDYPLRIVLRHLARRQGRSFVRKEELCTGRKSRGWEQFAPHTFVKVVFERLGRISRCMREQRETPDQLRECPHVPVVRLRSPRDAESWMRRFADAPLADQKTASLTGPGER